jgi:membrane-bound serine protease (ClpP class)
MGGTSSATSTPTVDVIQVSGVIDPPTADYLKGRLDSAQSKGDYAAIVELDTPGGLSVSMRQIVGRILNSKVPVVVWVAPRGARAASAGTFITYAGNLAYMAESTEIGAASPVDLNGGDIGGTEARKVMEDSVAYIRGIATQRRRDVTFAVQSVRDARSIDAQTAARIGAVDGVASSLADVLQQMDGTDVTTSSGNVTLHTWDTSTSEPTVTIVFQQMNLLQRLLHTVVNPDLAMWLLLIGLFGIIFEIYNPGIGLAGIVGLVCLVLGLYALSVLPTNWAGVALLVGGVIFFIVDLHTGSLGAFTAAGVVALIGGGMLLFSGAAPAVSLSWWAIAFSVAGTLLFFISVMTAALRVRLRRPITGEDQLVGTLGEAKTDIAPEGMVMSKGMLWKARTMETAIAAGEKVEIKAQEGLVLLVEPAREPGHEASAGTTHPAPG